eukprot:CAMPEP_0117426824 /NCGR_PEP_ID=MMETSP0758-20121206/6831_1 /TAXON_ID=63605 /ORGANISM="Percolomonas cosmopolitus, Strain AE-1 (ATCC 50343)" /LENGTH=124 /DNA_ID=CAMNT_0005212165 /DNA_START=334 /DNA_END=705 /DNA_ORIENTATION=-
MIDDREKDVSGLSSEQLASINSLFDNLDADNNGSISLEEAKKYYASIEEEEFKTSVEYFEFCKESGSMSEEAFANEIEKAKHWKDFMLRSHIDRFKEADIDDSHDVSRKEFVLHEARKLISRQK